MAKIEPINITVTITFKEDEAKGNRVEIGRAIEDAIKAYRAAGGSAV